MPSLRSNKNKWSLPPYPPAVETVCIPVTVPNDPQWIGLFLGALYRLTQQVWYDRDEAKTARLVAAVWQDIYLATVKRVWGCEGGELFDIRVSPIDKCLIEKTYDGVSWVSAFRLDTDCALSKIIRNPNTGEYGWEVEDVGFYRFPDGPYVPNAPIWSPLPRERSGFADTARCNAAYGAARVLQSLYQQTWGNFVNWATYGAFAFAKEVADFADSIVGTSTPFDTFLDVAYQLYEENTAFVENGFPDSLVEDVQNILYCRSSVVVDRVVFDHASVVADFQAINVTPYSGLAFLLTLWIDENMLNAAGNVDVGTGDCSGAACEFCLFWTVPEDSGGPFDLEYGDITPDFWIDKFTGVFWKLSASCTVDLGDAVVTRFGCDFASQNSTNALMQVNGATIQNFGSTGSGWKYVTGSWTGLTTFRVYIDGANSANRVIGQFSLEGTGYHPFVDGTDCA